MALSPHMGRSRGPVRLRPVHRRPGTRDGRDGPAHDPAAPDASGQPQLPATPIGYGYDAAGERTSLRYPGGKTLGYAYYPDGQLKSVSVSSRPGVSNSSALRAALDQPKMRDITLPVWDATSGSGSTATYHSSAFARVRLLDYQLPANKDLLSLRFLGDADCGAAPSGSPTPTGTSGPLASTRVITYAYDGLQRLTDAVENPGTAYHYA